MDKSIYPCRGKIPGFQLMSDTMRRGILKEREEKRFRAKYQVSDNGCWEWLAGTRGDGYGLFHLAPTGGSCTARGVRAHRYAYEAVNGPIPTGMVLDHLCRNRRCVNPEHMEVVTLKENCLRGMSPNMLVYRSGYCKRGHPHTPENRISGKRGCRLCKNIAASELLKKKH